MDLLPVSTEESEEEESAFSRLIFWKIEESSEWGFQWN